MKAEFPGYFPIPEQASKAAWKSGLFSFDASVLLDLYRYSDETRQELLKLLKSLGDRIWITHQAAQEFLDGRLGVIVTQSKRYEDSISALDTIESTYKSARGHPFLTKQLLTDSEALFKKLRAYLNGKKSQLDLLVSKDPIQEEIAVLLGGRIGPPFTKKRFEEIFAEGEIRYKDKIPPGYEDAKKPEDDRFGDLIIWFELIDKAHKEKKPLTFVTADEKEDWWRISKGKTIGPRPELVTELRSKAGVDFQMFSPERFMTVASERLEQVVKDTAIEEVKEVRKATGLSSEAIAALQAYEKQKADAATWAWLDDVRQGVHPPAFFEELIRQQSGKIGQEQRAELADELAVKKLPNPALEMYQQLQKQERIRNLVKQVDDITKKITPSGPG